jgi:hypothetical protein
MRRGRASAPRWCRLKELNPPPLRGKDKAMIDITQTTHSATPPVSSRSLAELIAAASDAHRDIVSALSTAIERALVAGQALNEMGDRGLVRHGKWEEEVYPQCGFGRRQAQRYKLLARLAEGNATYKSQLAGCTIEGAIKKLSPPRDPNEAKGANTSTDDDDTEEPFVDNPDEEEMRKRRALFLKQAHAAHSYGLAYDGPIDKHVIKTARAVRDAWAKLARELREESKNNPPSTS